MVGGTAGVLAVAVALLWVTSLPQIGSVAGASVGSGMTRRRTNRCAFGSRQERMVGVVDAITTASARASGSGMHTRTGDRGGDHRPLGGGSWLM
jgi:hypothetical protein